MCNKTNIFKQIVLPVEYRILVLFKNCQSLLSNLKNIKPNTFLFKINKNDSLQRFQIKKTQ